MTVPVKLNQKIEAFLAQKSVSEGGFAPVDKQDAAAIADILRALIAAKYEKDPDGDLPISFQIVDRTRHENTLFMPIRHLRDEDHNDISAIREVMRAASTNVAIAQSQMERALRYFEFDVVERLEQGKTVRFGKGVYERRTPYTDNTKFYEAVKSATESYVAEHPPVGIDDFQARQNWSAEASRYLSAKLKSAVAISAFGSSKTPEKLRIGIDCFGLGGPDGMPRLSLQVDRPDASVETTPTATGSAAAKAPRKR